jgi:3-phenylpropionate/trans-cinnamate dioxygenase ferredoxin reductase subunit
MTSDTTYLIAGASLAGAKAAQTLREEGCTDPVIMVGAETEPPYERPPLSKEYLLGEAPEERLFLHPTAYYAEKQISLRLGQPATRLDAAARRVELADGRALDYDHVIIATGARPRRLAVPGAELAGVLYLRDLADARALRGRLEAASRVVVVGAGFIGAEVAAAARRLGREVSLLEMLPVPLERALGATVGELYASFHRAQGVDLRTGETVSELRGQGRVEEVVTASGARIAGDCVVVGVGVAPACDWLAGSGLALDNGILVDEGCRTSLPDVYAAGDVANWWHPGLGHRLRVEHFDNAQNQGVAAARQILGQGEPYAPVPYFWSDQYDLHLEYVGHASGTDEVVLRGQLGSGSWSAFYLRDGRLHAALAVNRHRELTAARQLIARRAAVSAQELADEGTDLRALARGA